jgi:hypothetical protein
MFCVALSAKLDHGINTEPSFPARDWMEQRLKGVLHLWIVVVTQIAMFVNNNIIIVWI